MNMEWISVKDRLPDDRSEMYLVWYTKTNSWEFAFIEHDGEWDLPDQGWGGANVTHWMPLPEPPKQTK
jgi:hypothetical protein